MAVSKVTLVLLGEPSAPKGRSYSRMRDLLMALSISSIPLGVNSLGGFVAPLLPLATIGDFWCLQHRCRYKWVTDSTVDFYRRSLISDRDFEKSQETMGQGRDIKMKQHLN